MQIKKPFNIFQWIKENKELLKPPIANKNIYPEGIDYIVMIVGGPNARKDYHYNETEEFFFQLQGDIIVKIQENGKAVEVSIKEGEIFLLPPKVPHSPLRTENSVGLVIERIREPNHNDGLLWFCDKCNHKLHETYFHLKNIEIDFLQKFKEFYNSEKLRTCKSCGHIMEADSRFKK